MGSHALYSGATGRRKYHCGSVTIAVIGVIRPFRRVARHVVAVNPQTPGRSAPLALGHIAPAGVGLQMRRVVSLSVEQSLARGGYTVTVTRR